jgi:hypothetical protein
MYPSLVLKNQFGEESNNFIVGGSSQLYCNFVVDSTNANGLGQRSLKGVGVKQVFMNTTHSGLLGNPNPAAGYIMIQLASGYSGYINGSYGFDGPVSGTPILVTTGVTSGLVYVIASVGTTSLSGWQHLGLPAGVTPAAGVAFVATSSTTTTGSGTIMVPATAGSAVDHIELVGDPNLSCDVSTGSIIVCKCVAGLALTAPADGTVIGFTFNMIPKAQPLI